MSVKRRFRGEASVEDPGVQKRVAGKWEGVPLKVLGDE